MSTVMDMLQTGNNPLPWQGVGCNVEGAMTAEQAIIKGNLNWPVEKRQAYYPNPETLVIAPEEYFIVRADRTNDNVLGRCKGRWEPLQNAESFDFFNTIVAEGEAIFNHAAELAGGQLIFLLAKLPGEFEVVEGDIIRQYLLLTNSHSGQGSVQVKFTPLRVSSQIALMTALRGGAYKVKHSKNVNMKLKQAKELMGIQNKFHLELKEICQSMAKKEMLDKDIREFFEEVIGDSVKKAEKLEELLSTGAGTEIAGVRGTLWHAYSVMLEFIDHYVGYDSADTRTQNIFFTGGARLKQTAFKEALNILRNK